jgi:capsular polysaccharide transport system permease protein
LSAGWITNAGHQSVQQALSIPCLWCMPHNAERDNPSATSQPGGWHGSCVRGSPAESDRVPVCRGSLTRLPDPLATTASPDRNMTRSSLQIQKAVLVALILRELKTRFGGRMIGLFWVLFEPIANISVMLLIRVVLKQRTVGVGMSPEVYLVVAMIPFFMMRNVWFQSMGAVQANSGLFGYRQVKPLDAMISRLVVECTVYLAILGVLLGFFAWLGRNVIPYRPLEYFGLMAIFVLLGFGLGLLTTVASHNRPVVATVVKLVASPLYLLSGVLIPVSSFPQSFHKYLLLNPFLHLVELTRVAFFASYHPIMGITLSYPLSLGIALFSLGLLAYWVNRVQLLSRV